MILIIVNAAQSEIGHVAKGEHRDREEKEGATQALCFQQRGEASSCPSESMHNHLTIQLNSHWSLLKYYPPVPQCPGTLKRWPVLQNRLCQATSLLALSLCCPCNSQQLSSYFCSGWAQCRVSPPAATLQQMGQPWAEGTALGKGDSPGQRGQPRVVGTALGRGDSPGQRRQPCAERTGCSRPGTDHSRVHSVPIPRSDSQWNRLQQHRLIWNKDRALFCAAGL